MYENTDYAQKVIKTTDRVGNCHHRNNSNKNAYNCEWWPTRCYYFWFIYLFIISSTSFGRCFRPSLGALDYIYSFWYSPPISVNYIRSCEWWPTRCNYFWFTYLFIIGSTCFGRCFRPSLGALDCIYSFWYSPPISVDYIRSCKYSQVLLMMGVNIARNM